MLWCAFYWLHLHMVRFYSDSNALWNETDAGQKLKCIATLSSAVRSIPVRCIRWTRVWAISKWKWMNTQNSELKLKSTILYFAHNKHGNFDGTWELNFSLDNWIPFWSIDEASPHFRFDFSHTNSWSAIIFITMMRKSGELKGSAFYLDAKSFHPHWLVV